MDKKSALKLVLKDKDRKSLPILVKELIHCGLIEKEPPFYYFTSLLYKKSAPDYRNFIGHKAVDDISKEYFNVTSSGPMIIEGNQNPHLIMLQMACGGIRNHDRYKEIFKEYI